MGELSYTRKRATLPGSVPANRSRLSTRPFSDEALTSEEQPRSSTEASSSKANRIKLDEEKGIREDEMRSIPETASSERLVERSEVSRSPGSLGPVQVELLLGGRDDPYEREADRVADFVVTSGASGGPISEGTASTISQLGADGQSAGMSIDEKVEARIEQSKGQGAELPTHVATMMKGRIGHDFSQVRVKSNAEAANLCQELNARAFANGSDIWLGNGESVNDVHLMAHELTHVAQQGAAPRVSARAMAKSNAEVARSVRDGTVQAAGPAMSIAYPDIFLVALDSVVEAARAEDWAAGEGDYKERGGWMMWNPTTDVYSVVQRRVGTWLSCNMGPTPADTEDTVMVAHYHQHPPLPPSEDSALWPVRPSDADRAFSAARKSPGIVRDYTDTTRTVVTDYEYGASTRTP